MEFKKIPLREIEKSIDINCIIDLTANKVLQLPKYQGQVNQGIGRLIFIYLGQQCGYNAEEICDYLSITLQEYETKASLIDEYYSQGQELFNTIGHAANYIETRNSCMTFYRKLLLAQNYLRYRFNYVP